jgi:uncharacterized protein with ParB-like and HNH nuclease domain/predicted transport protein
MKATEARLLDLLRRSPQFIIPIYQRNYSWTERECRQLWDDVLRVGRSASIGAHFVGSVVYIQDGIYQVSSQSPLLVIDGQQRLTTVSLLITALAEALSDLPDDADEPVDGFSPMKLREHYLINRLEKGDRHYKLLLSQNDRTTLTAVVGGKPRPKEVSVRVIENFELFLRWIGELKGDFVPLCLGLTKLLVVDVALTRDQDNPQLIFESMNSTGRELTQADLIRNFVLMGLDPDLQTRLYEDYWRPMELDFGQVAYTDHFDGFMRHYLTLKTGTMPNVDKVYDAFKAFARASEREAAGIEALTADIRNHASAFCAFALKAETDPALRDAFEDLQELKVDVASPLLLELYQDYRAGLLSRDDFLSAVRLIEAYVFRRAACAIPANSLNKTFATFGRALKKDRYLESFRAHLMLLPSYRRFPHDEEFRRNLETRDLYNFGNRRSYWLRRLENHGRKERVSLTEYTIEHIMPQNEHLSAAWRSELGPEWKRIQEEWLHTLGNLTLTRYNSENSDRPFADKRDMENGFGESPLHLNRGLGKVERWDEAAIQDRARHLSAQATIVWTAPQLSEAVLATYRPKGTPSGYTIDDHSWLKSGPMKAVFEALRTEILALDPCVTEEFLKLYVAYKAETNFVDIVPQQKRLRLSLNLRFSEIDDPRGLSKDITKVGRWGNGDVEVGLSSVDDVPYVMGLIRQSFEQQMSAPG